MNSKFNTIRSLTLGMVCCASLACQAQMTALNLKQIYETALEQDASIRASRAATDAGREKLPQARAGLMPQISASASRNDNNLSSTSPNLLGTPVTTTDQYFSDNRSIQLRQPIVNMQRWLQFEQAKSIVEEAEANLETLIFPMRSS